MLLLLTAPAQWTIARHRSFYLVTTLALVAFVFPNPSKAQVCIVPDAGGTAAMPPECMPAGYTSPTEVHMIIDGLPPDTTIMLDASHRLFSQVITMPGGNLGGEIEFFNSNIFLNLTGTGELSGFSRQIAIPGVSVETHIGPRTLGDPIQDFDTQMVSLQGELTGDPDFDLLRITAGSARGLPSPGHTTLTRQGGPGSDWAVESFFDVAYEIEFVGAPGGQLDGLTGTTEGDVLMQVGDPPPPIPAISEWGLIILAFAGLTVGTIMIRRAPLDQVVAQA